MFWLAIRVLIVVSTCYKIYMMVDWQIFLTLDRGWGTIVFCCAILLYLCKNCIDAWRAKRIASTFDVSIPLYILLKTNLQAVAFDFVLPVPQAEEIYRFSRFSTYTDKTKSVLIILGIKLSGLVATGLTLILTILFTSLQLKNISSAEHPNLVIFLIADFFIAILLGSVYLLWMQRQDSQYIRSKMEWLSSISTFYRKNKWLFIQSIILGILSQMAYALSIYLFSIFDGGLIDYFHIFLIIPLIYFGALVPIGIAGIGVKEAIIGWALQQYGVPEHVAWTVAACHLALMLFYTGLGAIMFVREDFITKATANK